MVTVLPLYRDFNILRGVNFKKKKKKEKKKKGKNGHFCALQKIFQRQIAGYVADLYQSPQSVASDGGLHCSCRPVCLNKQCRPVLQCLNV